MSPHLLELRDVSYALADRPLLASLSFTVDAGEYVLLTGPSGSGKSTLLKIIASLIAPDRGSLWFNGRDLAGLRPESYRQQVSWCSQTPALFGETVWDNLALPWLIRKKQPDRDALCHWLSRLNLASDTLDKAVSQLSGGEKQRIGLLRNLQFLPQVLLLDEVTSALDEENTHIIHQLIDELVKQGVAVVAVSHDAEEIARASRRLALPGRQHA